MHWSNSHKLEAHLADEAEAERRAGVGWEGGGAPLSTASAVSAVEGGGGGGGRAEDAGGEKSVYCTSSRFFSFSSNCWCDFSSQNHFFFL